MDQKNVFVVPTLLVGFAGGALATVFYVPIPWLIGSLIVVSVIVGSGVPLDKPPATLERFVRVLIGVALGPSVAGSLQGFNASLVLAIMASVLTVLLLVFSGTYLFQRFLSMSRGEAFLSSLPGGLSFMMALADDARVATSNSRPRIALIHTVRVVSLILFVSLIASQIGSDIERQAFVEWFAVPEVTHWQGLLLLLIVFFSFWLANTLAIAGGHVTIPLIIASIAYASGFLTLAMPALVITLAMMVLGTVLGCELGAGSRKEYPRLALGSLLFTCAAFVIGAVLAFVLGDITAVGFLTLFLALAPGGIAEVALIALALGLDVGLVALVHLSRFLFIMLAGPLGLNFIARK